ncbi:DUF3292 domain-containing protein [Aspergillus saccharolyticus JOP 1030-1]|uniref:Uncharacterized protein n=1 Tax=Aspergillus saccharolyticus JOP 1030-1 TaxID=1450539 RepID=A0A318ZEL5_9EURO|nr:hypothetical protein BP01DRAFT_318858 [Aspergillus saccharolyticus JOP 1030-1]PYH45555.1 hypothetical protein BP01DRAFT_318858 [Aspergillus saccharolyticus JOP 1030-1]
MSLHDPTNNAQQVSYSTKNSREGILGAERTTTTAHVSGPTDSHILSKVDQDEKGLAQRAGDTDNVTDVGWDKPPEQIHERIVSGLSNEDLWMLIRRFNKQIYYVKAMPEAPLQRLDMNRAEDEQFSPDKLRATLERFYTTIVVSLTAFVKHIARLRSWRERDRTAGFCLVYFAAWILDLLAPTFFAFLLVLVVSPQSRQFLFPPAPIPLVSTDTGGIQKPKAGVLGSHDSITGAPEKMKGEAAEREASNLITSVASVAVGSVAGKHDQGTPEDAPIESSVPDAMEIATSAADAQTAAHGERTDESHDKTKEPMRDSVYNGANLAMRILADIIDTWERFGNALSPTPPFSMITPYLRLASVLSVGFLTSLVVSAHMFVKMSTFGVGFAFFGDPIIRRGVAYLNREYPRWEKLLELQNSLLKGIPTNAQLTLTLLRIGEANGAPLPPPPSHSLHHTPSQPAPVRNEDINLDATDEEINAAIAPTPQSLDTNDTHDQHDIHPHPPKKGFASRMLGFFRGTTATGIESKLAVDRAKAAVGSKRAKGRVGVLRKKGQITLPSGPVQFDGRYRGKRGVLVIDQSQSPPLLYFTTDQSVQVNDPTLERRSKSSVLFSMPVSDIREMRKVGGLGWKGKLVTGWAVGSKEVVDGLNLVGKLPTQNYQLTAMKTRDQLFNRLVAIDGQVWASY